MKAATARQSEVLQFMCEHHAAHGKLPSVRAIGRALGIKSPNGVMTHIRALEKKGLLKRVQGERRLTTPKG